jgi:ArsR family transcriptional regulator
MERHYSPGRTWESLARALVGLVRLGDVLDVGGGDGAIAQILAPRAKSITLVDRSEKMVQAARVRLKKFDDVIVLHGDAHSLPSADRSFDQVLLFNVLTHVDDPARVVGEAARVLRKGGTLALVTLHAHAHADLTAAFGDRHAGFSPAQIRRLLGRAKLEVEQCEVTAREKRAPYFQVVTAFATRAVGNPKRDLS